MHQISIYYTVPHRQAFVWVVNFYWRTELISVFLLEYLSRTLNVAVNVWTSCSENVSFWECGYLIPVGHSVGLEEQRRALEKEKDRENTTASKNNAKIYNINGDVKKYIFNGKTKATTQSVHDQKTLTHVCFEMQSRRNERGEDEQKK